MGHPTFGYPRCSSWRVTRKTETSQYPQEKKAKAIPLVRATESGTGQTERYMETYSGCGVWTWVLPNFLIRSLLESSITEGDNPVGERKKDDTKYPE